MKDIIKRTGKQQTFVSSSHGSESLANEADHTGVLDDFILLIIPRYSKQSVCCWMLELLNTHLLDDYQCYSTEIKLYNVHNSRSTRLSLLYMTSMLTCFVHLGNAVRIIKIPRFLNMLWPTSGLKNPTSPSSSPRQGSRPLSNPAVQPLILG